MKAPEATRPTDSSLAYLYCDHKQHSQQKPQDLVRNIVKQIFRAETFSTYPSPRPRSPLDDMYERRLTYILSSGSLVPPTLSECMQYLSSALGLFSRVYIVIDALDECIDGDHLIRLLGSIHDLNPNTYFLITSRFLDGFLGRLEGEVRASLQLGSSKLGGAGGAATSIHMVKAEREQPDPGPVFTIPLNDVKPLAVSKLRWVPRHLPTSAPPAAGSVSTTLDKLSLELVQRKVKAALNKMTLEKFDKISNQIIDTASQSKYETDGLTLRALVQLTFEKAIDEAAWSSMYAKFCKAMMEGIDPNTTDENIKNVQTGKLVTGGALVRRYLLNRCQEEFQRGWRFKVNQSTRSNILRLEEDSDKTAMLPDEYYYTEEYYTAAAVKRRGLGLIQFIGELFMLGMLTERIMHKCMKELVDYDSVPKETEVESLCTLLRVIGASLDSSEKSRPAMDAYFVGIQTMIAHSGIQSRLKFMLMVGSFNTHLLIHTFAKECILIL